MTNAFFAGIWIFVPVCTLLPLAKSTPVRWSHFYSTSSFLVARSTNISFTRICIFVPTWSLLPLAQRTPVRWSNFYSTSLFRVARWATRHSCFDAGGKTTNVFWNFFRSEWLLFFWLFLMILVICSLKGAHFVFIFSESPTRKTTTSSFGSRPDVLGFQFVDVGNFINTFRRLYVSLTFYKFAFVPLHFVEETHKLSVAKITELSISTCPFKRTRDARRNTTLRRLLSILARHQVLHLPPKRKEVFLGWLFRVTDFTFDVEETHTRTDRDGVDDFRDAEARNTDYDRLQWIVMFFINEMTKVSVSRLKNLMMMMFFHPYFFQFSAEGVSFVFISHGFFVQLLQYRFNIIIIIIAGERETPIPNLLDGIRPRFRVIPRAEPISVERRLTHQFVKVFRIVFQ